MVIRAGSGKPSGSECLKNESAVGSRNLMINIKNIHKSMTDGAFFTNSCSSLVRSIKPFWEKLPSLYKSKVINQCIGIHIRIS